jgi:dUTP pyrophosphatase
MKVRIKRVDKSLPLPKYESPGAAAFDLIAREATSIEPQSSARVPVNIVLEIPEGYMLLVKDRSSTIKKKGLISIVGIIDHDYRGENDEVTLQFFNPMKESITIEKGERLGQAAFVPIAVADWEEVDSMAHNKTRGGFGSTGHS